MYSIQQTGLLLFVFVLLLVLYIFVLPRSRTTRKSRNVFILQWDEALKAFRSHCSYGYVYSTAVPTHTSVLRTACSLCTLSLRNRRANTRKRVNPAQGQTTACVRRCWIQSHALFRLKYINSDEINWSEIFERYEVIPHQQQVKVRWWVFFQILAESPVFLLSFVPMHLLVLKCQNPTWIQVCCLL